MRDIAAAEDALCDAFAAALEHWPVTGVPQSADAWLLTTARRKLIDAHRRATTRDSAAPALLLAMEEIAAQGAERDFIDERLKLLFVCAHPAIDAGVRTPLMLQSVLGLDAARIGSAFLVAPATMGQRLVRAKRKIAAAGIPFETPAPEMLAERVNAVLDSIYAAFGAGYDGADGADPRAADLSEEALFLGALVTKLLPENAEALGLLALMLFSHSRRNARRCDGRYVAFREQDISLWDAALIDEAEAALKRAADLRAPGRYQLEAAIQSAHTASRMHSVDAEETVIRLYDALLALAPSTGAEVARAAALLAAGRAAEARRGLKRVNRAHALRYQPYWATLAHVYAALGDDEAAAGAYDRAVALSEDAAIRRFLIAKKQALTRARQERP